MVNLSQDSLLDYRAVVALNNIGVTLLEQRCHRLAMMTFKDALDLMGALRLPTSQRTSERAFFLQNAFQHMSFSLAQSITEITATTSASCELFDLKALTLDNSADAITAALHGFPSGNSGFAFRIEFDEHNTNLNVESATLLHNYSVTCRMKALVTKKSSRVSKLFERACMFSEAANVILSRETAVLEEDFQLERAVVASMLVLQDLIQLSSQQGDKDNVTKYYGELGHLRTILTDTIDDSPTVSYKAVASAA